MDKFRNSLMNKYLFHIHTNYTDGQLSCRDYFKFAVNNKIKTLIFTEHVRKVMTYEFSQFVNELQSISKDFPGIDYKIGIESKILPDGSLDIDKSILQNVKIICFACHGFPKELDTYYNSFNSLFKNNEWKDYIRVWVHPGRFLNKNGLLNENLDLLKDLINTAANEGVLIEYNMRDHLPPKEIPIVGLPSIVGYDVHTMTQLNNIKEKM